MRIYGIPCSVKSPEVRRAIRVVLRQIRRRAPEDFKRISRRVREFAPLRIQRTKLGRDLDGDPIYVYTRGRFTCRRPGFDSAGSIQLLESGYGGITTLAHELGHACTSKDEFYERLSDYDDQRLVHEICAQYYVYKWGFGRHADRNAPGIFGFHPNATFTAGPLYDIRRYRVTHDFKIRDLGPAPRKEQKKWAERYFDGEVRRSIPAAERRAVRRLFRDAKRNSMEGRT
jgi:hypothetical protein